MKTDPRRAEEDERILRLRCSGLSLRAIGQQVGLSHQGVADRIRAALGELVTPAAEEYRALESVRLDDLTARAYGVLAGADTLELRLRAVDRLLRLSESRRRLWGLDAPKQLDVALEQRLDLEADVVAAAVGAALDVLDLDPAQHGRALAAARAALLGEDPPVVPVPVEAPVVDLSGDVEAWLAEQDAEDERG